MRRGDLAKQLISAENETERKALLAAHPRLIDGSLARHIKTQCYKAWAVDPAKVRQAASALSTLAKQHRDDETKALSAWVNGIAAITSGKFDSAIEYLDNAAEMLIAAGNETDAAQTQVANLLALGMLGRYDAAVKVGTSALRKFVRWGDELAAGKIEMNLSNIVSRQERHREAERYCLSARRHFIRVAERGWQAMAENGLANTYMELNEFRKAEQFYLLALAGARTAKMKVTEAEVEASLGNLELLRGRYAAAMRYFELSRQKFQALEMPHQSAIADLEIADIYRELNLTSEALAIYRRVAPLFRRLKLRPEEARARLNYGRSAAAITDTVTANRQFHRAFELYQLEQNTAGKSAVRLSQAEHHLATGNCEQALAIVSNIEIPKDVRRLKIDSALMLGEAQRQCHQLAEAERNCSAALTEAKKHEHPNAMQFALNSLGKIRLAYGDIAGAKSFFRRSINVIDSLRAPLTDDEFNMSFFASRLEPFDNLTQLLIRENKIAEAFGVLESERGRSLLDSLGREGKLSTAASKLRIKLEQQRAELNFHYKRIINTPQGEIEDLRSRIRKTEGAVAETQRQINSLSSPDQKLRVGQDVLDLSLLKRQLGKSRSLIEYVEFGGRLSAFVINGHGIKFFRDICTTADVDRLLAELRFQFGALRYGYKAISRFAGELKRKCDTCLAELYKLLLRPLAAELVGESLVIISFDRLNDIPFHALRDESGYLLERYEISRAPSAAVWSRLRKHQPKAIEKKLLIGFADEAIPFAEDEVRNLKKSLEGCDLLAGRDATFSAYLQKAPNYDLIHFACHGQFRVDNPMFSSLHLADGWVTVHDVCANPLKATLVTLSACETGVGKPFAGGEILGLARGFLAAGARCLIVSLWRVDDKSASRLMQHLYERLEGGSSPAAALRTAQLEFVRGDEHPYYWGPFIIIS